MLRLLAPVDNGPPPASAAASRARPGVGLGRGSEARAPDPLGQLSTLVRAGSVDAERTLLVAVGPAMLRVIRGVLGATHPDVEDTLQEAMVAVHLAMPGFRGECTTLHFACRIAIQTAMNARRRAGYRSLYTPSRPPDELAEFAGEDDSPAERHAAEMRRESLRKLVAELPEAQAEVLALHAVLGYTIEETAEVTAAPVNTVRSRLRNALAKLRTRVNGDAALLESVRGEP